MSASTAEDRVLWSTELRDGEELRVTTSEFRGTPYVSLRRYWRNGAGQWCPTKKGCTFNIELVPEVIAALEQAAEAA